MSHYRANATAPQFSTALRNVGTGAALVGFATLQGVDPASPANLLDARTSTRPSFARNEFFETSGLSAGGANQAGEMAGARPNIVLIMCDDLGFSDIGSYGGEIYTPNLDRMAREGLRFRQFYNDAKCTQTRSSLLSGLHYQQTNTLKEMNHVTLAEALKEAGYSTLMVGKWHVGNWSGTVENTPTRRGFDRFFGFLGGTINHWTGMEWELYNVVEDRIEQVNLIDQHSERASRMARLYEEWARYAHARDSKKSIKMGVLTQDRYLTSEEIEEGWTPRRGPDLVPERFKMAVGVR